MLQRCTYHANESSSELRALSVATPMANTGVSLSFAAFFEQQRTNRHTRWSRSKLHHTHFGTPRRITSHRMNMFRATKYCQPRPAATHPETRRTRRACALLPTLCASLPRVVPPNEPSPRKDRPTSPARKPQPRPSWPLRGARPSTPQERAAHKTTTAVQIACWQDAPMAMHLLRPNLHVMKAARRRRRFGDACTTTVRAMVRLCA